MLFFCQMSQLSYQIIDYHVECLTGSPQYVLC